MLEPPTSRHHHLTPSDWEALESDPDFRALIAAKRRFVLPATIFFLLYFFALPVLVGYDPALMSRKVWGQVNLAYVFALSEFVMAWVIMLLYIWRARTFDRLETGIVDKVRAEFNV
ncbi:MAG: DUF485 domain-containing protein [Candidatus Baltobacteraceae bacterium]